MNTLRWVASALLVAGFASGASAQTTPAAPAKPAPDTPHTYGTTVESYYRMAAAEFTPLQSSTSYSDQFFVNLDTYYFGRYSLVPNGEFIGTPHLPSGAQITYLELDSCDFNASHDVLASIHSCDYTGHCGGAIPLNSSQNVVPNACSYAFTPVSGAAFVANNYGGQFSINVQTGAGDATTSLSGFIIGYKLQVAPAPATPTFNDVPASDFGFQYVEALNLSGITGGCGGGAFCPTAPVTRRQMAIFLAKALGLYLPQF